MHPVCPDVDLCEGCEALPIPQHPANHPMLKMKTVETVIPTVYRLGQISAFERPVSPKARTPSPPLSRSPFYENGYLHNPSARMTRTRSPSRSSSRAITPPCFFPPRSPSPETFETRSPDVLEVTTDPFYFSQPLRRDSLPHVAYPPMIPRQESPPATTNGDVDRQSAVPRSSYPWRSTSSAPLNHLPNHTRSAHSSWSDPVDYALYKRDTSDSVLPRPHGNAWGGPKHEGLFSSSSRSTSEQTTEARRIILGPTTFVPCAIKPTLNVSASTRTETQDVTTVSADSVPWFDLSRGLNDLMQFTQDRMSGAIPDYEEHHSGNETSLDKQHIAMESPLNNEALLIRPPTDSSEMHPSHPASHTLSLSALLNGFNSIPSLSPATPEETIGCAIEAPKDIIEVALSAGFVEDMTVPDGQKFAPGVTFVKCWRLINNGTREWPESTEVSFVGGTSFTSQSVMSPRIGEVKPGAMKDIWTMELKVLSSLFV